MNARVFIVLVFSSIFMGIWNSDQRAMDSTIARNKRLKKPVAVFPMPSLETVRPDNMSPAEFLVPEPRPVRLAMRASGDAGQNEPVIERDEQQIHQSHESAMTPVDETVEAESAEAMVSEPVVPELVRIESSQGSIAEPSGEEPGTETALSAESSVSEEPVPVEPQQERVEEHGQSTTEVVESKSNESIATPGTESPITELTVAETSVAQIESVAVPAPEDFALESTIDSRIVSINDPGKEESVVEPEAANSSEVAVIVAENSTDEILVDHSGDASIQTELNGQPAASAEATASIEGVDAELPEPADPIIEDSVPQPVSESLSVDESVTSEAMEDEKLLEKKLLQTGEYDMLDVHADDVTPGSVEPALEGGATCIPLPRNLASGTWQVIHSSGEFFKITVDRGRRSSENHGVHSEGDEDVLETSFCITTTPDGMRWCFIRSFVDSPVPVRRVTTEFFSPGQQ